MVKFRRKAAFCSVNPPSQTKSHLQPLRMPGREVGFHLPRGCLGQLLPRSGQKWGKFQENHQIIINMFSVEWVAVCCRSWKSSRAIIVACLSPHFLPKIWIHPYLFFSISHANFDGLCFFSLLHICWDFLVEIAMEIPHAPEGRNLSHGRSKDLQAPKSWAKCSNDASTKAN